MTRIYTKTGDAGETGLFGGGRVPKDDERVEAYGEVDELNATLGLVRGFGLPPDMDALMQRLQDELFTVGAVLATPTGTKASSYIPELKAEWAEAMEKAIDAFEAELSPMTHFVLPGGTQAASALHLARTVCRRAERVCWAVKRDEQISDQVIIYINRLSDHLFVQSRWISKRLGEDEFLWDRGLRIDSRARRKNSK